MNKDGIHTEPVGRANRTFNNCEEGKDDPVLYADDQYWGHVFNIKSSRELSEAHGSHGLTVSH